MATREQLQARIEHLESRLASGIRELVDQNGERVSYASGRELSAALAVARQQLAALDRPPINSIRFVTSKGI